MTDLHSRKAADDGIIAWDCKLCQEIMLIPYKLFLGGDNPMQAEECSHGGLRCNYLCRTCKVGGTNAEKKSDKGYCEIFKVFSGSYLLETESTLTSFMISLEKFEHPVTP